MQRVFSLAARQADAGVGAELLCRAGELKTLCIGQFFLSVFIVETDRPTAQCHLVFASYVSAKCARRFRLSGFPDGRVAVGMPVARHPPHRSVHALLTHTALILDI